MTLYEIPSVAIGPELTLDYDERTKFAAARYFFGWWGGLSMALLVYFVFLPEAKGGMENVEGWSDYGLGFINNNSINIYLRLRASPSYPKLTLRESKTLSLTESVEKFGKLYLIANLLPCSPLPLFSLWPLVFH